MQERERERERTVLDCGANACGISFEFAKDGYRVTSIEKNTLYVEQAKLYQRFKSDSGEKYVDNVTIFNDSLFNSHTYGSFDIILMLGLYYHFRYPQLFLDYCSGLDGSIFVFSTQTIAGTDMILRNRNLKYKRQYLMGWEPTFPLFKVILESSGFEVLSHFQTNSLEFTNNAYLICKKSTNKKIDIDLLSRACSLPSMWS